MTRLIGRNAHRSFVVSPPSPQFELVSDFAPAGDQPEAITALAAGIDAVRDSGLDFAREDPFRAGVILGTAAYMSPEQAAGKKVDVATDVYALGVILYECLTLCRPFEADSLFVVFQAIVAGSPRRPSERRPDLNIPSALEEIVHDASITLEQLLERQPALRTVI